MEHFRLSRVVGELNLCVMVCILYTLQREKRDIERVGINDPRQINLKYLMKILVTDKTEK